jgi:hypothetical protein
MDFLTAQHNVRQFILVGNCTLANICFNTALIDPRVTGLAITNPYIPEALCETAFFKIRKHLFRRESWLRLFTGRMKAPRVSITASANPKARDDSSKPASGSFKRDTILPNDFEIKLEKLLTERAVQALLVFSSAETSLHYFRHHYGKTLTKLSRAGRLRFEIAATEAHDFSANDDCAAALNEVLSDWVTKTWISAPSAESLLGPTADLS